MSLMAAMNKMKSTTDFLDIDTSSLSDKSNIGLTRSGQGAVGRSIKVSSIKYKPTPECNTHIFFLMTCVQFGNTDESTYKSWTKALKKDQKAEEALLAKLMDPSVTKDDFTKLFMQHVHCTKASLNNDLDMPAATAGEKLDRDRSLCMKVYKELRKDEQRVSHESKHSWGREKVLNMLSRFNYQVNSFRLFWTEYLLRTAPTCGLLLSSST